MCPLCRFADSNVEKKNFTCACSMIHCGFTCSWDCLRRGGYDPPALAGFRKGRVDFACGRRGDGFALRGDLLCPRRQSRQSAAGGGSRAFTMPYPAAPRTPVYLRGSHQGAVYLHPARVKDRIPLLAPPAAAPCCLNRYLLLQERSRLAPIPRGAVRWSLRLRGWCLICKTAYEYASALVLHSPSVSSTAGLFWRESFQVTANPWGYIQ